MLQSIAGAAALALLAISVACQSSSDRSDDAASGGPARTPRVQWGMVVHGGAGTIAREQLTGEREREYRAALTEALRAGHGVLEAGGHGLDAVVTTLQLLEDSPLFNAGRGAVFTADGVNPGAWDSAIREFNTLRAGSTARVQRTARVWGESWHVSGLARTLRNLLFKSRKDNDFQYNDWLYGQDGDGVPAARAA